MITITAIGDHLRPEWLIIFTGMRRLRPHRGISQEKLPEYLGFFQFVPNARHRGKALLSALIAALVT